MLASSVFIVSTALCGVKGLGVIKVLTSANFVRFGVKPSSGGCPTGEIEE